MKCVILAGGSGDRLWPLSRKNYPKQFLNLYGENSLFQETITRNIPFCDEFYIVTNMEYRLIVEGQLKQFQGISCKMILEEEAKGTAPALALVSAFLPENEDLLVIPSDLFLAGEGYSDAVYQAKRVAAQGQLVLFGVRAEEASTLYGYIRHDGERVTRFLEKPSQALADKIFYEDDILWNSGMLYCRNGDLRREWMHHAPSMLKWAQNVWKVQGVYGQYQTDVYTKKTEEKIRKTYRIDASLTSELSRTHVEKTLLEQSEHLAVVPLRCSWIDISNFDTYEKLSGERRKNVICSSCENTLVINAASQQLVVANGLRDMCIVNTNDAIYVTDRESAQDIKGIIAAHPEKYQDYFDYSPMLYRQWGIREVVAQEKGYRVRKLTIYPGRTLTRHIHTKRNENYSIVSGTLSVELEDTVRRIGAGESINILPNVVHRLFNDTDRDVIAIEVDTGDEINEQDMLRMEDEDWETQEKLPSIYRLAPAYKDYLWGGHRLAERFGKDSPYEITAESWELSAHPDGTSHILGGAFDGKNFADFVDAYGAKVCGWKSNTFDRFPILIKFIDAAKPLSIQVHPFDDYAFVNENEFGKNEMWYVMEAEPGAYLYCGFSRDVSREELERHIADHTITELLNKVEVKAGDVIFIPAGTIHAIGAGILLCEIQQNSNSTYRVYDYDRRDAAGQLRPLHIGKALDVLSLEAYHAMDYGLEGPVQEGGIVSQRLCLCKYFECTKYQIREKMSLYLDDASFASLVFLSGTAQIACREERMQAKAGDSFFISAGRKVVHVEGNCEFIVTNI